MRLGKPQKAIGNITGNRKNIAHVMEYHSTDIIAREGHRQGRGAKLQVVYKEDLTPQGKAGLQIARASLVDAKTTERIAASSEEPFGERNKVGGAERLFHTHARGTGKDPAFLVKQIVGRIVHQHPAEVGLRPKDAGGHSRVEGD